MRDSICFCNTFLKVDNFIIARYTNLHVVLFTKSAISNFALVQPKNNSSNIERFLSIIKTKENCNQSELSFHFLQLILYEVSKVIFDAFDRSPLFLPVA